MAAANQVEVRLRRIQKTLGIQTDGVLGPETLTALENRLAMTAVKGASHLECSRSSLDQIVRFEVGSKGNYDKSLQSPVWPGGHSGVTIGIGYDIGVTAREQIEADWRGELADSDLTSVLVAQGTTGVAAKLLATRLKAVRVPFATAQSVFYAKTLPRYSKLTRDTYDGVESLPADAQGMLLSLIYNRGSKLTGPSRVEMAGIKPLVAGGTGNLDAIADQFEKMVRLWPDSTGLQQRRRREAAIVRNSQHAYSAQDLVRI